MGGNIGWKSRVLKKTPTFTIKTSSYKGHPIVEVLKDGAPIHIHDEHFRFGLSKAKMLLACLDVLKDFGGRSKDWSSMEVKNSPRWVSVDKSIG